MPVSRLITGMEIVGWRRRGMVRFQGYALELIESTRESRLKTLFEPFVKRFCETEKDQHRGKRGSGGRVRSAHLDRVRSSGVQCVVRMIPAAAVLQAVLGSFD